MGNRLKEALFSTQKVLEKQMMLVDLNLTSRSDPMKSLFLRISRWMIIGGVSVVFISCASFKYENKNDKNLKVSLIKFVDGSSGYADIYAHGGSELISRMAELPMRFC